MPPTTWYCVTTSLPPHACRAVSRCRWSTSTWKNPLAWREIQIPQLQDPQRQGTRSASPDYSKNWQNRFLYQIQPKKLQAYVRDVANICLSVYLFICLGSMSILAYTWITPYIPYMDDRGGCPKNISLFSNCLEHVRASFIFLTNSYVIVYES